MEARLCLVNLFHILVALICVSGAWGQTYTQPEQIHLSWGADPSEMVVTWVTVETAKWDNQTSVVEYGTQNLDTVAIGKADKFQDGGSEKRTFFNHRVKLTGLKPLQRYVYHVGSSGGWSQLYFFTTRPIGTKWSPRFAIFGDMGNSNARALAQLQDETQLGHFDAILHVGDFAYDLATSNARVGDAFMNQVQSVAAYVPYMTCVGNHEYAYNFSNYKARFTMPGGEEHNMFYSFDVGPAHVVAFSSEYYYFTQYGFDQIWKQYQWLENDLKEANKPENRAERPWIIAMCHRPLYCSNSNDPTHCTNVQNLIRVGLPLVGAYSIEQLLYKYGVDLHFQAHEHSYERMWPVYNRTVCNGSRAEPYKNPKAPVHIVTGSGGDQEGQDPFLKVEHPWSAFHSDDYGYTRLTIHNNSHIYLDQVSVDQGGKVVDDFWLIKDHHGPYTECNPAKANTPSRGRHPKDARITLA